MNEEKMNVMSSIDDMHSAWWKVFDYAQKNKNSSAMNALKEIEFQILELTDAIEDFGGVE